MYKRKLDTRDELLGRIMAAFVCIKGSRDKLRRVIRHVLVRGALGWNF